MTARKCAVRLLLIPFHFKKTAESLGSRQLSFHSHILISR
jgi:hypothetical protein